VKNPERTGRLLRTWTGTIPKPDIKQEIIDCLSKEPKPLKLILFGSHAHGMPHEDSDIDLLVVLDRKGKSPDYGTLIRNRREISARLRSLKKKCPVDLIVYTKDEWEELKTA
jgi:predicted nucleotidyltransferase